MEILNTIFSWIIRKRLHDIELFVKYPHDVQQEVFSRLISRAKNTEWGKQYKYSEIKNVEQFKSRVPIQDYDDVKKYVIRLKKGEKDVLWPGEIKWFAKSSGTTSDKSKFIPISKESLEDCHYKGGKDMISLYYHANPDSKIFAGKSLHVGGSSQVNQFSSDSYYGDLSAILMRNLPFWVVMRRTPDLSIALMSEWEEKLDKMAKATQNEDVTNIAGVPSWTLLLLRKILDITGKKNMKEIWPNLELFIHGGVRFTPYQSQYDAIIPPSEMNYLETYNASEGFFGIQDQLDKKEMLLMLDYGIYYEFVPESEMGKKQPKTLGLSEVELDKNYALIISTNGGLWRYKIGDTISFCSLDPYRIRVTGRTKSFINAFGEELIEDNAEKALRVACEKTEASVRDYTAAPIYMSGDKEGKGGHQWLIEFENPPENLDYFKETFDNALKSINSDYEAKRHKNLALQPPQILSLPKDTFYNWLKSKGKLGGQNKVPRLFNTRKHVDEILEMMGKS